MTAKGKYFAVIAGVVVATVVSFLVSSVFVKRAAARDEEQDLDAAQAQMKNMKAEAKNQKVEVGAFYFNNSRTWFKKIAVVLLSAY